MSESDSTTLRRRERYGLLLGAIILSFSIQGIATPENWEEVLVAALLGITVLLAFWTADVKPVVMWPAVLVVAAVIVMGIIEVNNGNGNGAAMRVANALLVALAPPAVVVGVVRNLRARQAVTLEAVFGVLCVYLLLGMFFAFVYGSIDRLGEGTFFAGGQQGAAPQFLYYSFTTLTTVGYGDYTARSNLGHTLSVSEALLGQIYLVTVVSLIVANLGRSRPRAQDTVPPS